MLLLSRYFFLSGAKSKGSQTFDEKPFRNWMRCCKSKSVFRMWPVGFLDRQRLIIPGQYGFRSGRSKALAVLEFNEIRIRVDYSAYFSQIRCLKTSSRRTTMRPGKKRMKTRKRKEGEEEEALPTCRTIQEDCQAPFSQIHLIKSGYGWTYLWRDGLTERPTDRPTDGHTLLLQLIMTNHESAMSRSIDPG